MDYVETFQNLRTNNKYGRKSPHKAVLMLTVIELYEQNVLLDNEIFYDDTLKSMFLKVWNRVLPNEPLFHPEAYLPFWYLQSDSFWHIVPVRGKEDILSLMRDVNIKPSEAKLYDCVRYAELDEDLFFLMTLPSGRSSLKKALLETYFNLSDKQIDQMAESTDNSIDYSVSALSDYEKIISNGKNNNNIVPIETDNELVRHFQSLNEDIQIVLNLQYFSFLKTHRGERELFKEICPTVYNLFDKIVNHPIIQGDIAPSFAFAYDNFLSDLKIALMSEDGSMELIDKIGLAIDLLRGNNNNVGSTEPIAETNDIEPSVSDIEEASYDDKEDSLSQEYIIENKWNRCYIIDSRGERVFSSDGQLIRFNNVFYKVKYTNPSISIFLIQKDDQGLFVIKRRILSARNYSPLIEKLDEKNYLRLIKDVKYDSRHDEYYVQIGERWYGSSGYYADLDGLKTINSLNDTASDKLQSQTESQNLEALKPKKATVNDDDYDYPDLEIEHVYLDSRGKIIEDKTSHEVVPESNSNTESRKGKPWTENEEELITLYFKQGKDTSKIAEIIGRTEVAIKARLAKLGLIDYTYGQEDNTLAESTKESDFSIENSFVRCFILNKKGERVFSAEGKMKYLNGKLYRLNLKNECFTVKCMTFNGEVWMKGAKKIVAYPQSELYRIIDNASDYYDKIEDIDDCSSFKDCRLKVNGIWYSYDGSPIEDEQKTQMEIKDEVKSNINDSNFSVKIGDVLHLFPSQLVGRVVKLRIDNTGRRKIVVKSDDGPIVEVYDSKYLYEKLNSEEIYFDTPKKSISNDNREVLLSPPQNTKIKVGDCIQWKPTGDVGRIIGFKQIGAIQKIVLRLKGGSELEVFDNPQAYDVILRRKRNDG